MALKIHWKHEDYKQCYFLLYEMENVNTDLNPKLR